MKETWKMFSTVRGKECGSTTKSKKDIGVSAIEKKRKNNNLQNTKIIFVSQQALGPNIHQRQEGTHKPPAVGSKRLWRSGWHFY